MVYLEIVEGEDWVACPLSFESDFARSLRPQ